MATDKKTLILAIDLDTGGSVTNIGKLTKGLFAAKQELKDFNKSIKGQSKLTQQQSEDLAVLNSNVKTHTSFLREATNESAGLTKAGLRFRDKMAGAFKTVNKSVKGFGLALKAAGIGLIIAAFGALKRILESQQPVLDAVETAFTFISLGINAVVGALKDVFKSTKESTGGFDALGKVMSGIITIALAPFKLAFLQIKGAILGAQLLWEKSVFGGQDQSTIDDLTTKLTGVKDEIIGVAKGVADAAGDIVTNFSEAVGEIAAVGASVVEEFSKIDAAAIASQASRTTALKNAAAIAEAINAGLLQQFDRQAELLRQVRDEETNSIDVRIAANEKLGETLQEQEDLMLANADRQIEAAQLALDANRTTENTVLLIQAQTEAEDILAAVEGFRSEQLINRMGLIKEVNELDVATALGAIERAKQIRDHTAEQIEDDAARIAAKQANLEIERVIEEERLQIILNTTLAGTQARIDAQNELLAAKQQFELDKLDLLKDAAEQTKTIDTEVAENKEDANKNALAGVSSLLKLAGKENKTAALTAIIVDTAVAIGKAVKAGAGIPFPGNLVAIASGIGSVLSGVSGAKSVISAAAGGGDFMTNGPTMLLVGDNPGGRERVTVEPISGTGQTVIHPNSGLIAMAGGGTLETRPNLSSAETSINNLNSSLSSLELRPVVSVIDIQSVASELNVTDVSVTI